MHTIFKVAISSLFFALTTSASAYDVWLGAIYMPKDSAEEIEQWQRTAQSVSGLNVNLTDAKRPPQDKNTVATWKSAIAHYATARNNAMKPIPRTTFSYPGNDRGTIEDRLTNIFKDEVKFGYKIEWLMLYANKLGENAELETITYSHEEMQTIRNWLDDPTNGDHSTVRLVWNVRNNALVERQKAADPNIDAILMEAEPGKWYTNAGSRQTFLSWVISNPETAQKPIIFQIPLTGVDESLSPYQEVRKLIRWFSSPEMLGSTDFIRRDDVIILPVVYKPTQPFYPEINAEKNRYIDSQTGLALSLIEQKALFEGRLGALPTIEQVESFARYVAADTINSISDLDIEYEMTAEGFVFSHTRPTGSNNASNYSIQGSNTLTSPDWTPLQPSKLENINEQLERVHYLTPLETDSTHYIKVEVNFTHQENVQ